MVCFDPGVLTTREKRNARIKDRNPRAKLALKVVLTTQKLVWQMELRESCYTNFSYAKISHHREAFERCITSSHEWCLLWRKRQLTGKK